MAGDRMGDNLKDSVKIGLSPAPAKTNQAVRFTFEVALSTVERICSVFEADLERRTRFGLITIAPEERDFLMGLLTAVGAVKNYPTMVAVCYKSI